MATPLSSRAPFYEGISRQIAGVTVNNPILAIGVGQKQMNLPHLSPRSIKRVVILE